MKVMGRLEEIYLSGIVVAWLEHLDEVLWIESRSHEAWLAVESFWWLRVENCAKQNRSRAKASLIL